MQRIDGQPYLIAAYACSPVARFRLADLQHGRHVKGETIAEPGCGNSPIDLVRDRGPFENGREYVLITNDQRSPARIDPQEFGKAPPPTGQVLHPTGLNQTPMPFAGTRHIAMLVEFQFPGVTDTFAAWNLTHSETPAYARVSVAHGAGRVR